MNIQQNTYTAEYSIKKEISQLLFKYKHENDINEHRKQQFEINEEEELSYLLYFN